MSQTSHRPGRRGPGGRPAGRPPGAFAGTLLLALLALLPGRARAQSPADTAIYAVSNTTTLSVVLNRATGQTASIATLAFATSALARDPVTKRIFETNEEAPAQVATMAAATPLPATLTADSAAASGDPGLWSRTRALDGSTEAARQLVAQVELELARAAVGNERDSAAVARHLAPTAGALSAGAVLMPAVARTTVAGAPTSCPLAPHLARARRLLAEAESRQQQHLAALAAAEARLALLASVHDDDRVRTRPVHFALDRDELSPASRALLDKVSAALKSYPGLIVVLEGHTDPRGGVEYNLDLSRRRAHSVHRYLAETGLDVSRIEIKGYGLAERRTAGTTREAYALDRRVMVRFSMEDGTPVAETHELLDVQVEEARRAVRAGARHRLPATGAPKGAVRGAAKGAARPRTKATTRSTTKPRTTGGQR